MNDNIINLELVNYSTSDEEIELMKNTTETGSSNIVDTGFVVDIIDITDTAFVQVFYIFNGSTLSFTNVSVANNSALLIWLNATWVGRFVFTLESLTVSTSRIFGVRTDDDYELIKISL